MKNNYALGGYSDMRPFKGVSLVTGAYQLGPDKIKWQGKNLDAWQKILRGPNIWPNK